MKLASYKDGSRDGQLVVVSRDLSTAHYATGIAERLQQALDDWNFISPQLQDLYDTLNHGKARHAFPFDPARCLSPLPRAFQRVDACAYPSHRQLLAAAAAAGADPATAAEPPLLMHQAASDDFLGPQDAVTLPAHDLDIDFGAEIAVVTGEVPLGASPEQALDSVRLVLLANCITLRALLQTPADPPASSVQAQPATAFAPVAVTVDELGDAWQDGRVHLTVQNTWNGRKVGLLETGAEMAPGFGELIAHLARTRRVRAGSLIGSGTISNPGVAGAKGRTEWPKGYGCIAEKRAMETLHDGQPQTGYLQSGDVLRIDLKGRDGQSLCGAIEHQVSVPVA